MNVVDTTKNLFRSAAETVAAKGREIGGDHVGATDTSGPVTLTISVSEQEARALWRDRQRLSAVLGEFASVDGTGDTQFVWTVSSPTGEIVCPTEIVEDAKSLRYARTDGSAEHRASDLARISFEIAPKDLGTEVSLELALPVPDFVAKVAAFKVLYRARALLQTGEFPTLVPTPAARPGDR